MEGEATAERRLITNLFVQKGAAEDATILVAVAGRPDPLLAVTLPELSTLTVTVYQVLSE